MSLIKEGKSSIIAIKKENGKLLCGLLRAGGTVTKTVRFCLDRMKKGSGVSVEFAFMS